MWNKGQRCELFLLCLKKKPTKNYVKGKKMKIRAEQYKKATSSPRAQLVSRLVTGNVPRRVMDEACIRCLPEVCSALGYLSGFFFAPHSPPPQACVSNFQPTHTAPSVQFFPPPQYFQA